MSYSDWGHRAQDVLLLCHYELQYVEVVDYQAHLAISLKTNLDQGLVKSLIAQVHKNRA